MNKNIHSTEMHRLADAPQGTKVWSKYKKDGTWELQISPYWFTDYYYIIDDEWAELRKAIVDGKTIEVALNGKDCWETTAFSKESLGTITTRPACEYRIKPDVVEPTYYYQYERLLYGRKIDISEHMTEKYAVINGRAEANGWFKIESSKRKWEH